MPNINASEVHTSQPIRQRFAAGSFVVWLLAVGLVCSGGYETATQWPILVSNDDGVNWNISGPVELGLGLCMLVLALGAARQRWTFGDVTLTTTPQVIRPGVVVDFNVRVPAGMQRQATVNFELSCERVDPTSDGERRAQRWVLTKAAVAQETSGGICICAEFVVPLDQYLSTQVEAMYDELTLTVSQPMGMRRKFVLGRFV